MSTGLLADVFQGAFFAPGHRTVGAAGTERIIHINHSKQARLQWDLFSLQPLQITAAIPFLMVTVRDGNCRAQVVNLTQQLFGINRMAAHDLPFGFVERARFE